MSGSQRSGSGRRNAKHDVSYILNDAPVNSQSPSEHSGTPAAGHRHSRTTSHKSSEKRTKQYTCQYCGYCFKQNSDMNKHIRTVHEKLRPFKCEYCERSFGNLKKHTKSVHLKERPFHCRQCSSTFAFKDGLLRHVQLVHDKEKPFQCRNCHLSFKKIAQLRSHNTLVHGVETNK